MTLLQMSVSGAVLVLSITVIRAFTIHRLPKRTFLILWTIAALRLLLPVSIPSVLSAYSWIQQVPLTDQVPEMQAGQLLPMTPVESTLPRTDFVANSAPKATPVSIWLLLWGAGIILCMSFFAVNYLRCRMEFRTALPVNNPFADQWCRTHVLRRKISIRQLDIISTPLTYGVLRPVILMPKTTDWTAEDQLEYILLHEYIHIRRFDTVKKLVLILTVCLHWFNPMAWVLYALYNRDIELFCDEQVVRMLGRDARASYARTLIDMEETRSGLRPLCSGFSKTAIEERIRAIMKMKKVSMGAILAAIMLVVGVTTVFATSAATAEDVPAANFDEKINAAAKKETSFSELLKEYAPFGVAEKNGNLYYHGELVRFFLDGYEIDESIISRHEEYNSKGTVDVHTVRKDKRNQDGSTELFGPITDIVAYSQEEFDQREFSYVTSQEAVAEEAENVSETVSEMAKDSISVGAVAETVDVEEVVADTVEQTAVAAEEKEGSGQSFPELFRAYAAVGIDYVEEKGASGRGNVYYEGKLVKNFVDISPTESFTFQSAEGGTINAQTVYDKNGKLTGIKVLSDLELEDLQIHIQSQQELAELWQETLAPYVPFGLSYVYDPTGDNGDGDLKMTWKGKEVRGIMDEVTETWITEHTGRTAYGADAVELYAVYKNGVLNGLREATKAEMNEWNAQRDQARQWRDTEEVSEE